MSQQTDSPMETRGKQIFFYLHCISCLYQTINIWCQLHQGSKLLISVCSILSVKMEFTLQ